MDLLSYHPCPCAKLIQEKNSITLVFRIMVLNHLPQPVPYTALDFLQDSCSILGDVSCNLILHGFLIEGHVTIYGDGCVPSVVS